MALGGTSLADLSEVRLTILRRERIGFVFQAFNLLPSLTVAQNIALPLRLGGRGPRRSAVREMAARVGLDNRLRDRPSQLSGGQQQRVAIARALITRPEVLFATRPVWRGSVRIDVSSPAKTIIDMLDDPAIGGGIRHVADCLTAYFEREDASSGELLTIADQLDNRAVFKRLGYLVETLGRDEPELIAACQARLSTGLALLDPDGPPNGPRVPAWGIRANVRITPGSPS